MAASSSSVRLQPLTVQKWADADPNRSFLVSGGFAIVQPGSQLSINAVEGFPLEDFSADVRLYAPTLGFIRPVS